MLYFDFRRKWFTLTGMPAEQSATRSSRPQIGGPNLNGSPMQILATRKLKNKSWSIGIDMNMITPGQKYV